MAGTAKPTLQVILAMLDNLSGPLRSTASTVRGISDGMKTALAAVGTAAAGLFSINFARGAIEAAAQLEGAMADIKVAVGTTKSTWAEAKGSIDATLDSLDKLTNFTRTDLASSLARMIESTGNVTVAEEGVALAADIAKARHLDLSVATDLVAKAAAGNTKAFKLLGITLQDNETPMQALIRIFGSFIADEGPNARDMIAATGKAWEEFKVQVGEAMIAQNAQGQATNTVATIIKALGPVVADIFGGIAKGIVGLITDTELFGGRVAVTLGTIPLLVKEAVGVALGAIGTLIATTLGQLPGIGHTFQNVGLSMQQTGQQMVTDAKASQQRLLDAFGTAARQIMGLDDASTGHQKQNYDALVAASAAAQKTKVAHAKAAADATLAIDKQLTAEIQKDQSQFLKDFAVGAQNAEGIIRSAMDTRKQQIATWQEQEIGANATVRAQLEKNIATARGEVAVYGLVLPIFGQLNDLALEGSRIAEQDASQTADHRLDLIQIDALIAATNQKKLDAMGNVLVEKAITETLKGLEAQRLVILGKIGDIVGLEVGTTGAVATNTGKIHENWKQSADQALRVAEQAGLLQTSVGNVLTSAIGMADAFERAAAQSANFTQNLSLGSVSSLAGAALTLGSAIVGILSNPAGAAERALIAKNNEALAALTRINGKLVDQTDSGAKIQRVLDALNATPTTAQFGGPPQLDSAAVAQNLLRGGGSFQDVVDLAKSLGIDLGKTNQETSAALLQLRTALQTFKPQSFGSDFQGQLDQASFQHSLSGGGSGLTLGDYKSALTSSAGSPLLAQLFEGLDLNNPADLATLGVRIQAYGGRANSLGTSDLGQLNTSQFTATLSALAALLPTAVGAPAPAATAPVTAASAGGLTSASAGATPATTFSLPSTGTITMQDAAGWGFKQLGDFLGPKIDGTNARLDGMAADLYRIAQHTADTALAAAATAKGIGGDALLQTMSQKMQAQTDMATVNAGGA